jgi:hypothetical protein
MHHQLQLWGLAGLLPLEDEEQARKGGAPHKGGERKGRGGGKGGREDAERLPDAVGAKDMFEYAIARLKSDLHYIQHLEEVLKGPIFEARHVYSKETDPHPLVYRRNQVPDELSAERWEALCAEQGKDPACTDTLYVSRDGSRYLAGTSPWPTMPLVRLIAAYCICAKNTVEIEELLVRLHPNSREPDKDEVYKYIDGTEGVLPRIKKLAQVVRGKPITRGLNAVGEDLVHHTAGDFIRGASERGIPDEEITRTLREDYELPEEEIARLKSVFAPRRSE